MSSSSESRDEFFTSRGFGNPLGVGERPAVVVVDVIPAFTSRDSPLGGDFDEMVAATQRLLKMARQAQLPIYFTTTCYRDADLADAGLWRIKQSGTQVLRYGTEAVAIDPRLDVRPEDAVVEKRFASAFFGTELHYLLAAAGVDGVIIVGCTTSGCVRATAVDAIQLGYRPTIVTNCVADRDHSAHDQALFDVSQRYGDVKSLDELKTDLATT